MIEAWPSLVLPEDWMEAKAFPIPKPLPRLFHLLMEVLPAQRVGPIPHLPTLEGCHNLMTLMDPFLKVL